MGPVRVPAYSASAALYDIMVGRFAFEHWRENLERLERRCGLDLTRVADAACGTGLAAAYLAGRGAEVIASDLSPQMLRQAAQRAPQGSLLYMRQDMRYLQTPRPVTLVNCATDALNHLLAEADLRRALASFRAALCPGGYALFDMNTAWQLREGGDSEPWEFEVEGRRMRWLSDWDEARATSTLSMVFIDHAGRGRDVLERHVERAYEGAWVLAELRRAGFSGAEMLDAAGLGKPGKRSRRLLFIARA